MVGHRGVFSIWPSSVLGFSTGQVFFYIDAHFVSLTLCSWCTRANGAIFITRGETLHLRRLEQQNDANQPRGTTPEVFFTFLFVLQSRRITKK